MNQLPFIFLIASQVPSSHMKKMSPYSPSVTMYSPFLALIDFKASAI